MTHLRLFSVRLFLGLAIIGLTAQVGYGQNAAARPDRGISASGSYAVSDIESINLTNGNLNLSIPLASLPPMAGGKLGLTVRAVYNSKVWDVVREERHSNPAYEETLFTYAVSNVQFADPIGGWSIGAGYSIRFESISEDYQMVTLPGDDPEYNLITGNRWSKAILTTPDGSTHELRPLDATAYGDPFLHHSYLRGYYKDDPDNANQSARYYSFDGSHLWVKIDPNPLVEVSPGLWIRPHGVPLSWTLYMPDGTRVVQADGIQRIIDTNQNKIKIFGDSAGTHYQDEQSGREITVTYDAYANSGNGQVQVHYPTVGGVPQTIYVNLGTTTVLNKAYVFGDSFCSQAAIKFTQALPVVRSIVFPQTEPNESGRQFSFAYNSDTTDSVTQPWVQDCFSGEQTITSTSHGLGSLSQMTMPSGAVVKYGYRLDGSSLFDDPNELARDGVASKQLVHDGTSEDWGYDISSASNTSFFHGPDGSSVVETRYSSDPAYRYSSASFDGKAGLVYRTKQSNKILIERHWTLMNFGGANIAPGPALVTFNPVVDAEYTTLLDDTSSHNPIKMSAKTYSYDYNGNLLTQTDYDWFDPSAQGCTVSRDAEGVPTGVPGCATALRTVSNAYYNDSSASTSTNVYARRSLSTVTPLILNALQQSTIGPAVTQLSYDYNSYGVAPSIGNLTSKRVYDDVDSKWITTSMTYDTYGNVETTIDGRGKVTTIGYDSCSHAQPTSVTVDPQNGTGAQVSQTVYDCSTGLVTSTTDINGRITTIGYTNQLLPGNVPDPFGRPGITTGPAVTVNGSSRQQTVTNTYYDSSRQVIVASDLFAVNDQLLKARTTNDMLGRVVLTEQTEDGTNYSIFSRKAYNTASRVTWSSSPMRCTIQGSSHDCGSDPLANVISASTDGWTRATNDVMGRPIEVATFGGASQPAATGTGGAWTGTVNTSYDANTVTVTDEVGKQRKSSSDALGRLTDVWEAPNDSNYNYHTSYDYDVFGNLKHVYQGDQTRTFTYDSLSRLRSALNPESGTITYGYDDNGNLIAKTDARSVITTYAYDALNRVTSRGYSDSTPTVTYAYDTASNGKGRLTSVSSSVSSYTFSGYDELGRVLAVTQTIGNQPYSISYAYDLAGHVTTVLYPSNRTVNYNYDNAGRLADKDSTHPAFTGNLGDNVTRTYAKGIVYGSAGQMTQEQFGTSTALYNKLLFNSRGQLAEMRVGTASGTSGDTTWNRGKIINDYSSACSGVCDGANNNGNLLKQSVYVPNNESNTSSTSWYQQYTYDPLDRLEKVHEYTGNSTYDWQQQYVYDRFGNRTIDQNSSNTFGTGIPKPNFTVVPATNRLSPPSGTMHYDDAGNLDNDTFSGGGTRTYDAENRVIAAQESNSTYSYDGDGHRVKRVVGGVETWQVYGVGGELIAEYAGNAAASNPQKEYGYRNGQLLITAEVAAAAAVIPANLTAAPTTNSTSSNISLSWAGVDGAGYYRVERKAAGENEFTSLGTVTTASKTDTSAATATAYLYRVCTAAESNGDCTSDYSNIALGARFTFPTDPTIVSTAENPAEATPIKAAHITELRTMVNAVRSLAGWSAATWTHPNLATGDLIYKEDVKDLRDKLNEALSALGILTANWEDAVLAGAPNGTPIRANHIRQLRARATSGRGANSCYKSIDQFVKDFYQGVLHRQPDSTELAQWTASLTAAQNTSQAELLAEAQDLGNTLFHASAYGSPSDEQFMTDLYTGYLHRQPNDPPDGNWNGYNFWMGELQGSNREHLLDAFEDSIEFKQHVSGLCVTSAGGGNIHWLVPDHLGTPRMVFDQSGSLAKTSRHDYLPFGEDIYDGTGLRTVARGYTNADGARQKFTSKERDNETGLDYFLARYYSSAQGRFTSPDEFSGGPTELFADVAAHNPTFYAELADPQSLNKYHYGLNNPMRFLDPDGHQSKVSDITQVAKDTVVGGAKGLYNAAVSVPNTINTVVNAGLDLNNYIHDHSMAGETINYRFPTVQYAQPSTTGENGAMWGVNLSLLYFGAKSAQASGAASVESARTATMVEEMGGAPVKTYQTYTKTHPGTGDVYSGRTSGYGTPLENIARRDSRHPWTGRGYGPAKLDKSSRSYEAIRGREQSLIEYFRRWGKAAPQINGISPKNPNRPLYCTACRRAFGQ